MAGLKYGSHDFPADCGFTGSADKVPVREHLRGMAHGGKAKVAKVMGEFKEGALRSGSKSGPVVTNPRQARAIALSEAGLSKPDFRARASRPGGYKKGGFVPFQKKPLVGK